MYAFKAYSSYFLLHGSFFLLAMIAILLMFESRRKLSQLLIIAVAAVAPFVLISFAILGVFLAFPSIPIGNVHYVTASSLKLALAFLILWRFFNIDARLAAIYTILLVLASAFSPIFVRALLKVFDGQPGAMITLLIAAAVPAAIWIVARRVNDPTNRMLIRCVSIAAIFSPTVLVGHGGAVLVPAGMVWTFLLRGGTGAAIQFFVLAVSVFVTTLLLVLAYKGVRNAVAETPLTPS